MIISRQDIRNKLLAHLNDQITLAELVDWAENTVGFADLGPDEDVDLLMDVLMYLAAADSPAFPLTDDVLRAMQRALAAPLVADAEIEETWLLVSGNLKRLIDNVDDMPPPVEDWRAYLREL